jgi:hypothetical protein
LLLKLLIPLALAGAVLFAAATATTSHRTPDRQAPARSLQIHR